MAAARGERHCDMVRENNSSPRLCVFEKRLLITATLVLLAGMPSALVASAQVRPPPIIVPQVTPRFNDPGPQVKLPQPGSPTQQRALGTRSQVAPGHQPGVKHRHSSRTHNSSRTRTSSKPHSQATSSRDAPLGQTQSRTSGVSQENPDQTATDKKLKELDDALDKKMKSICRGC
jgi:hypothetical protein